jgi:hypothetical protein
VHVPPVLSGHVHCMCELVLSSRNHWIKFESICRSHSSQSLVVMDYVIGGYGFDVLSMFSLFVGVGLLEVVDFHSNLCCLMCLV